MNAAAKLLNQRALSRHWVLTSFFTRGQVILSLILCVIFMSAFSIIYITNVARDLQAGLYQGRYEYSRLYAQEGQLLLERSTLSMQARVQGMAEKTLNMETPDHQRVVLVHE